MRKFLRKIFGIKTNHEKRLEMLSYYERYGKFK